MLFVLLFMQTGGGFAISAFMQKLKTVEFRIW